MYALYFPNGAGLLLLAKESEILQDKMSLNKSIDIEPFQVEGDFFNVAESEGRTNENN